jgi:hypothetical protein
LRNTEQEEAVNWDEEEEDREPETALGEEDAQDKGGDSEIEDVSEEDSDTESNDAGG